jgi:hypothetical protein
MDGEDPSREERSNAVRSRKDPSREGRRNAGHRRRARNSVRTRVTTAAAIRRRTILADGRRVPTRACADGGGAARLVRRREPGKQRIGRTGKTQIDDVRVGDDRGLERLSERKAVADGT